MVESPAVKLQQNPIRNAFHFVWLHGQSYNIVACSINYGKALTVRAESESHAQDIKFDGYSLA